MGSKPGKMTNKEETNLIRREKKGLIALCIIVFAVVIILNIKQQYFYPKQVNLTQIESYLKENQKVQINTASFNELISIPGIGRSTAKKIIGYRDAGGTFKSKDDLLNINGIGEKKLEKMKEYISLIRVGSGECRAER